MDEKQRKNAKILAKDLLKRLSVKDNKRSARSLYLSDSKYKRLEKVSKKLGQTPSNIVDELLGIVLEHLDKK